MIDPTRAARDALTNVDQVEMKRTKGITVTEIDGTEIEMDIGIVTENEIETGIEILDIGTRGIDLGKGRETTRGGGMMIGKDEMTGMSETEIHVETTETGIGIETEIENETGDLAIRHLDRLPLPRLDLHQAMLLQQLEIQRQ